MRNPFAGFGIAPAAPSSDRSRCVRATMSPARLLQLQIRGHAFNTRNEAANQPARLAHLDDGNDRAILVQGDALHAGRSALGLVATLIFLWAQR